MRTGMFIRTGIACLVLCTVQATGQERRAALTGIRYTQEAAGSRLALQFSGEIRYALSRSEGRLTLGFPGTELATPTGTRALRFRDGLVQSVTPARSGKDSLVVVVQLREGSMPTLMRPSAGNMLVLDVSLPPGTTPAKSSMVRDTAPVRKVPAAQPERGRSATQPSLVDIPALARQQAEERRRIAEQPPATRLPGVLSATVQNPGGQWSDLLLMVSAVVLAVASTVTLLLFLRRRAMSTPQHIRAAAPAALPAAGPMKESTPVVSEPVEPEVPEEEPLFDDRLHMARAFQRGKEEVNLALTMQARAASGSKKERLARAVEHDQTYAQRRTAARKLGLGVGEVELAVQLKKLQGRTKQKEAAK